MAEEPPEWFASVSRSAADWAAYHAIRGETQLAGTGDLEELTALTLKDAAARAQAIHDAAKKANPDILVLWHGRPIAEPADAQYVYSHTERIVGFVGASIIERVPTEAAIQEQVAKFKAGEL